VASKKGEDIMATTTITPNNPGATVTHYQETADQVKKFIESARATIPTVDVPSDMTLDTRLAILKDDFIATAVGMYDGSSDLQKFPAIDLTDARDTLQYMDAYRPVILLLENQIRHLKMQFKVRKQRAAENALLVYQLAKTVSRATPGVDLDAHLGTLKRQLSGGKKKAVKASTPKTTTTSPSTPAPPAPSTVPATTDPAKKVQ
jgi:hypothetical protein